MDLYVYTLHCKRESSFSAEKLLNIVTVRVVRCASRIIRAARLVFCFLVGHKLISNCSYCYVLPS